MGYVGLKATFLLAARRPEHFASRRHHTQLCQLEENFHISQATREKQIFRFP